TDIGHAVEMLVRGGEGWVSPEAWTVMTTEGFRRTETSGYGFGLASTSYRGHPSLTHHGSVGGYYAMAWALPDDGLGVAVLVNVSHGVTEVPEPWSKPTQRIMQRALDTFLGLEEEPRASSIRAPEEWDRFVGVYHSDFDLGTVTIARDGDTLWYADQQRTVPLLPYARDSFLYAVPDDDGTSDYVGVSFDEGTGEDIGWLLTDTGVARRR
ncbi:MAG: serine hydrolase, partial [Myxococcota bacterium]